MRWLSLLILVACEPVLDDRPDFDGDGIPDVEDSDADGDGIPDDEDDFVDLDSDGFDRLEDCDDADPAVNPAATEVCGNGKDDDCDGSANTCRLEGEIDIVDQAVARVRGSEATDALGTQVVLLGDADGDGFSDLLVGAGQVGRAWRYQGIEQGSLSPGRAAEIFVGQEPSYATSVSGGADLTGAGGIDIVIGQPAFSDSARSGLGRIEVREVGSASPVVLLGRSASDAIGAVTHVLADVDEDGRADLWTRVGRTPSLLGFGEEGGRVEVVLQVRPRAEGELSLPAAGDVDGDGETDLLFQEDDALGFLFLAPGPGGLDLTDADAGIGSLPERGFLRSGALALADLDGDGYDEAILEQGSQRSEDRTNGRVQIAAGGAGGPEAAVTGAVLAEEPVGVIGGLTQVGDLDGDGRPELLVGRTDGSVGVFYDLDPRAERGVTTQDALFVATPENPVRALDVAPAPNQDATRAVALGFPAGRGQVYLLQVSGL